jgi:hypothetical protein
MAHMDYTLGQFATCLAGKSRLNGKINGGTIELKRWFPANQVNLEEVGVSIETNMR